MSGKLQGNTKSWWADGNHDRESAELMHGSYSAARTHPADIMEPEEEESQVLLGALLARLNQWVANGGDVRSCGMRFLAMSFVLNPEASGFRSEAEIARKHGLERATVSKLVSDFRDTFAITTRPMRSERTRKVCREAQQSL